MDIVVDASVLIAVVANEPEKELLIELTRGANLIAPNSIHWEIGNAFSAMLKRKRISLDEAVKAVKAYEKIPVRFVEVEVAESLELASELDVYAYDAYLIRCAIKHDCPLISLDGSLIQHARKKNVEVMEVSQ